MIHKKKYYCQVHWDTEIFDRPEARGDSCSESHVVRLYLRKQNKNKNDDNLRQIKLTEVSITIKFGTKTKELIRKHSVSAKFQLSTFGIAIFMLQHMKVAFFFFLKSFCLEYGAGVEDTSYCVWIMFV